MITDFIQLVLRFFTTLTPADIVDIIIVTFAVYKAIQLIQETRAETLTKGLLLILVTLMLSNFLNLNTVNYILQATVDWGVIALLIMFQPELRRALELVGRSKLVNVPGLVGMEAAVEQAKGQKMIDEITDACEIMSEEKVGALIVIEQHTKIGEIIRTGTVVDAEITSALLRNIFFKNSPLHDGAMVIREGRIAAAGCFLPLSQNQSISRELGTRHRAGLGMSECCDAVVIIVSEETGAISIAREGQLTRNLSPRALSVLLADILCPQPKKKETKKFMMWRGRDNG